MKLPLRQYRNLEPGLMQFSKLGWVEVAEHAQLLKLTKNHFPRNDFELLHTNLHFSPLRYRF